MKKYFILTIFVFYHFTSIAQAQETTKEQWTLEECLEYAHKNNLQIKQLGLNVASAESNLKQSKMARLPNANGSFSHSFNVGSGIDPGSNSFVTETIQSQRLSISSGVTLFNGFIKQNTIKQRDLELELAKVETVNSTENLDFSILSAYLQILLNKEQLEVVNKQAELTQKNYEQTQKLVKAGVIPAGDLIDIEAQIARDQLNIVNTENRVANAYLGLAQSLDYYDPIEVLKPEIPLPTFSELESRNIDEIYANALQSRPAIKAAGLNTQIAEKRLDIAEGAKLPSVTLGGSLSTNYSSFESLPFITRDPYGDQLNDNKGLGIALSVNVPIFNNYQIKNNIAQSKLSIEGRKYSKSIAENAIRREIEQAYLDAKSAAQQFEMTKKNVEALEQSVNYVEKRYELGAVNTLDVFTAKNNLTSAKLQLQSAKYEYYFRLKILDFYEGKGVSLE